MGEFIYGIHGVIALAGWIAVLFVLLFSCDEYSNVSLKPVIISGLIYFSLLAFFIVGETKLRKQPWNYTEPYAIEKIVCLNDSNQINGKFYMRRGYIGEKLYYQYMVKLGEGYKANKVGANNTTLYYDDNNFRVQWHEKERHWLYFSETEKYQKIYIPEGSITDDYSIDLQ